MLLSESTSSSNVTASETETKPASAVYVEKLGRGAVKRIVNSRQWKLKDTRSYVSSNTEFIYAI